jgi:dTDP-4-amino-4,6-dideoxygalactose transaminase
MSQLAILGGSPIRTELFPAYNTIGAEEKRAVAEVLDSGVLSRFLGAWSEDFLGGPMVQKLERAWCEALGVEFAVSVNSNTSGLFAAMGACDIGPGDEVIVSPYTMTASAVAPMVYGAVPVFADIDDTSYCLSPASIEARITPRTKAILVVHIMGHPADMDAILSIAERHALRVVEDCAQAPMGKYRGRWVGTLGDIGVFSLNYHKHVHTGEGGILVTRDADLAARLQLIRNHGENIVGPMGAEQHSGIIGFNYRMTELEAAIGVEQLKKLPRLLEQRLDNVEFLYQRLHGIRGLELQPPMRGESVHTYYLQAIKYDADVFGVHRDRFVEALKAELPTAHLRESAPLLGAGYVKPLYLQPIYQRRSSRCSFNCPRYQGAQVDYSPGLCPVAERLHFHELITHEYMRPGMSRDDLSDVVRAFEKVANHATELAL